MKPSKLFSVFTALLVLTMLLSFTGCSDPNADVEQLAMIVTAEDISVLEDYPNLQEVDLRGSTCYDAIAAYIEAHPEVEVRYTVSLGKKSYENDTTELKLEAGTFKYDDLMTRLAYLPELTHIELPDTDLTLEQIAAISETYGAVTVDYTVELLGEIHDPAETELDLSGLAPSQLDEVTETLAMLPNITYVELMSEDGTCELSMTDVKTLQDAVPGAVFHYTFELFGQTVSTTDETIEYDEVKIGNEGEEQIRQALDILTCCTYFKLDDCGLDYEILAGIRDDYPDTKVVWRVHIEHFSMLTDEEMLRLTHKLNDSNVADLKYCTEAKYVDFGHNSKLTDVSFLAYMPNLECVILSGSPITDISAFENCNSLVWLELCFCGNLEDISVLEGKQTLKYLNISSTKVSDISMLDDVPLERFNSMNNKVSDEDAEAFVEKHPDCLSIFKGKQPYGYGWRYDDHGYTYFEYYANMREIFRYADESYYGNHKEK